MEPFISLDAVAAPLARPNIDTDQIVPSRYLHKPRSDDFGNYLFRDLRFAADGREQPEFVLNQPAYRTARIVVAERNFGCGSSREQAVWALHDYGIRAAIAPSFGDIFMSNTLKNGLLPVILPVDVVARALALLTENPGARIQVALDPQIVTLPDGTTHAFPIDPFPKHCLRNGLDEIAFTLTQLDHIVAYERRLAGT
jgi:3-isopropylmalate/(R)-2-methylmalate dehydratase small subunit